MGCLGGDHPLKGDEVCRHEYVRDQVQVEERTPEGHRGQQGKEGSCAQCDQNVLAPLAYSGGRRADACIRSGCRRAGCSVRCDRTRVR